MATVAELYSYLNGSIPKELSCDWDNDGLMCCPDNSREVTRVLFTLDVTERAAEYAIEGGFELIVSHHPLIFKPISSISEMGSVERTLMKLIKNDVAVFSFHTRLDALSGGVNDALAEKLGIASAELLTDNGDGRIGYIDEGGISVEEYAQFVKKRLSAQRVTFIDGDVPVRKVAIVGGSGKDFIKIAIAKGADTFLTGEIGYSYLNSYLGQKINLIEAGHFFTENPVLDKLQLMVKGYCDVYTEKYFSNEIKTV